ncbi:MAG: LemA family protein [Parcubacteria group bacterium GW2011_GWC1_45_13]|uniref:LemA family protein n=3 Tax=Candidatus Giovannoniibacteriota TaxID=1752738 RepID=A0A0G1IXW1_9BACT|nr:MAG: LemA family protein [Candidatus Giovannonibacteria bacterium GW2011_GWB1_44_23]KKT64221.1 MAG: LemA family protein [Candidatus Giovannonibacteria bacterium GW2011_GWA1_44_29]KKT91822.1 MAG: LemA family protein [Parcubacteria group bacterium GW2011_GWC1_45_13]
MSIFYVILGIIVLVILWVIWAYNRLVTLGYRAKEALSDIDVQLKRRYDLIPNVVETVKGYMQHERGVFEKVTEARAKAISGSGSLDEKAQAENALSLNLKTLFAVAENYPELKANANFLDLQRELADTENKIQAARRFYNSNVMELNARVDTFPTNLVASSLGFSKMEFFGVDSQVEKEPVKVKF